MTRAAREKVFEAWLEKYQALFFKFVRAYAFTAADRDDLFQEITLQVWRSIPNFRGEAAETTWLYRISLNAAIAWTRKERRHHEGREGLTTNMRILRESSTQSDKLDWLYEQIARFNEIDRALCLLLLDGFRYKEIAEMLGISESNVGVKLNRIKKKLIQRSQKQQGYGF